MRKRRNRIANEIKLEITTEIGMLKRGKYTFPNIPALAVKVLEVFIKHAEK